jgi:hypothetical protein
VARSGDSRPFFFCEHLITEGKLDPLLSSSSCYWPPPGGFERTLFETAYLTGVG